MSSIAEHPDDPRKWMEVVRSKVAGIRFGSVQIIVHEGRVPQVELIEKTRIDFVATSVNSARPRIPGKVPDRTPQFLPSPPGTRSKHPTG